ncbi:hypothetical protein WA026_017843 [Henosepilachna vigintioctopunctata]|uniref:Uncharacterized protein n=1 Tax=Henosepilachna vigintioctopunctata TaxID=420089 RepID=A0AAW1TUW5_9CUCU
MWCYFCDLLITGFNFQEIKMDICISEYHEAQERFQTMTEHDQEHFHSDQENKYLDEVIQKICRKSHTIDVGNDSTLFYKILFHSDFLQIKQEIVEIFYSELCLQFIRQNIFEDIIQNLEMLDLVPHLKKHLAMGVLQSCQLEPMVIKNCLSFRNSSAKIWHTLNLDNINTIIIPKSVLRDSKTIKTIYTIRCLMIFLRLCKLRGLKLSGCSLNEQNVTILSEEFQLRSLDISRCGPYVNVIVQRNLFGILTHLTKLDISNNNVDNATLKKIRLLPLKLLKISKCIRTSDLTMNLIKRSTSPNNSELNQEKINLDILWEDGVLRDTIRDLDVSFNNLTKTNLEHILELPLKQLDISGCLNSNSVDFYSLVFPSTLKILKARFNKLVSKDYQLILESSLEDLQIDFYSSEKMCHAVQFFNLKKVKKLSLFDGISRRAYMAIHRFD